MTSMGDPKYKFLFVVTYGRSGSTLLQGVLNSFDGYCIRGENSNMLAAIFRLWRECHNLHEQFGSAPTGAIDSWFGADLIGSDSFANDMIAAFKRHILNPPEWARVIGFKEIRYTPDFFKSGEFGNYFDFINEWFPQSAFIFNSRKLSDVIQSGWWRNEPEALSELQAAERMMLAAYNRFKHKSIWLRYEDYADVPEGIRGLAEFLGEPFDHQRVAEVLSIRHSFGATVKALGTGEIGPATGLRHEELVPPRDLLATIGSTPESFAANGEGFVTEYVVRRAKLMPSERVLDIDCGYAHKAKPLVRYLDETGLYDGFEANQAAVEWCRAAYSDHPNFRFTLAMSRDNESADINALAAAEYCLPYADETFDLVVCEGLFLRLPPTQLPKYVKEIARVLKTNGRCVVGAFLLTSETTALAPSENCIVSFPFERDECRVSSLDDPSPAVAVREDFIRDMFRRHGLRVCEVVYGFWANTPDLLHALHDCVVATKRAPAH